MPDLYKMQQNVFGFFGCSSVQRAQKKANVKAGNVTEAYQDYLTVSSKDKILKKYKEEATGKRSFNINPAIIVIVVIILILLALLIVSLKRNKKPTIAPSVAVSESAVVPISPSEISIQDIEVNYDKALDNYSRKLGISRDTLLAEANGDVRRACEIAALK